MQLIRGGGGWTRTFSGSVSLWKISSTPDVLYTVQDVVKRVESFCPGGVIGLGVAPLGERMAYLHLPESGGLEIIVSEVLGKRTPKVLLSTDYFSVQPLAFTPDGQNVLTFLPENRILVLDVVTGQTNRSFRVTGRESVGERNLTLSGNGRWLAITSPSKRGVDILQISGFCHLER